MQPLISVIMPAYNCGKYIKEAIWSVMAQTYPDKELIIVNDGSTDDTAQILKELEASGFDWIKIIHQPNKGAATARNRAIAESKGEYIAFLDADDYLHKGWLAVAMQELEEHKADVVSSNFHMVDENGQNPRLNPITDYIPAMLNYYDMLKNPKPLGFMVAKACYLKPLPHDEALRYAEDFDLWLRVLKLGAKWLFLNYPYANYRLRKNSTCHTYNKDIASQLWHIYSKHISSVGKVKAWLYYRKHLALYRYAMLKKALKSKEPWRIVKHAFIAARSPFFLPFAIARVFKLYI